MISFLFQCLRCQQRFRAESLAAGAARRCICGGDLIHNRQAQIDEILADPGKSLDDCKADLEALAKA